MPQQRPSSMVNAFNLVPVVEQVLPDRRVEASPGTLDDFLLLLGHCHVIIIPVTCMVGKGLKWYLQTGNNLMSNSKW